MARASSSSSQAQSLQATTPMGDLNVSTVVWATMAMSVSTETGVTYWVFGVLASLLLKQI